MATSSQNDDSVWIQSRVVHVGDGGENTKLVSINKLDHTTMIASSAVSDFELRSNLDGRSNDCMESSWKLSVLVGLQYQLLGYWWSRAFPLGLHQSV